MSGKKRNTLGKGLEALLGVGYQETSKKEESKSDLLEVDLDKIEPGRYQPRTTINQEELESLASSIRAQGVIQPIVVKRNKDNYAIVAGERRWRAARLAGLTTIPVVIKDLSEKKATAIALIENIQREDLSPLEEANALERLAREFDLTHNQVAEAVGKSRVTITNLLRLLSLPDSVKKLLGEKRLDVGHAKVLMGLKEGKQSIVAQKVADQGLSVRETEKLVSEMLNTVSKTTSTQQAIKKDPDIQRLETTLSEKLGASIEILHTQPGKGRVVIRYNSLDELEGILAHIQ